MPPFAAKQPLLMCAGHIQPLLVHFVYSNDNTSRTTFNKTQPKMRDECITPQPSTLNTTQLAHPQPTNAMRLVA